jgi:hypothetical protein
MHFSPVSYYFLHLRPKYLPQHPVLKHRSKVTDQISHLYTTTSKLTVVLIAIFIFLDCKWEDKRF